MAGASETITKLDPFVVTTEALQSLDAFLKAVAKENEKLRASHHRDEDFRVEYEVALEDGGRRTFLSLDSVLMLANSKPRRIDEMKVEVYFSPGTSVRLSIGGALVTILCTIRGDDGAVTNARQKCEEFCARIRSPFAWLYSKWWYYLAGAAVVAAAIAGGAAKSGPPIGSADYVFIGSLGTLVTLVVLSLLRNYLFPKQLFAIGGGLQRFETLKDAQRRAIWLAAGLLLTSTAGLVVKAYF